jgi:hypothetical protein
VMVQSRQRRKQETVGNCYQATTSDYIGDFMCCSTMISRVCRAVKRIYLPVVTRYKNPINPIIIPNRLPNH